MKRILPSLFLLLSLLCTAASAYWGFTCISDYRALCADPSVSGVDFLGVGFLYGLGFVLCAIPGLVFSGLCNRFAAGKKLRIVSYVIAAFFILCLLAAVILWLFGPGHP